MQEQSQDASETSAMHVVDNDEKKMGGESSILSGELREWWVHGVIGPVERFLIRNKVSPMTITMIGLFLVFMVGVLFAFGKFFWAGWLLLFAGSFDFLDGRVARATNQATAHGAYVDSITDRYMDGFLFAGLAVYYQNHWIFYFCIGGLIGSLIVSYAKSRAQAFGVDCNVGLMQRPERIAYLGFSAVVSSYIQIALMPFYPPLHRPPQHLLMFVIVGLCVATNITALQRIFYTIGVLKNEAQDG